MTLPENELVIYEKLKDEFADYVVESEIVLDKFPYARIELEKDVYKVTLYIEGEISIHYNRKKSLRHFHLSLKRYDEAVSSIKQLLEGIYK